MHLETIEENYNHDLGKPANFQYILSLLEIEDESCDDALDLAEEIDQYLEDYEQSEYEEKDEFLEEYYEE